MARFERIKTADQETHFFQENVASAVEPLLSNPLLSGQLLAPVTMLAGVAKDVSHGLGRAWRGWVPVDVKPAASSGWTAPPLLNSWVNYGAGYNEAGYRLGLDGVVRLRGLIKSGTATTGTTLFTLPAAYWPATQQIFPTVSDAAFAEVRVVTNGDVLIMSGTTNWFSLDVVAYALTAEPAPLYRSASPDETRLLRLTSSISADVKLYVF